MPFLTTWIKAELWGFVFDNACYIRRFFATICEYSGNKIIKHNEYMQEVIEKYKEEESD